MATPDDKDKVTAWDENGKPVQQASAAAWDEKGNPIPVSMLPAGGPGFAVSATGESPETQMMSGVVGTLKEFGKDVMSGAGRGLMRTGTALSPLLNKIPYIGETLAPSSGVKAADLMATPKNTAEKIGFTGEQAGEWLLPTGAEEKGGLLAARMLPKLGRAAPILGRITTGALESGVRNKLQGGEFTSGALMGGGTGAIGEGMRAAAPKVAESALGITNRMRGRGRTIGESVLNEIGGIRPATIAKESGAKIGELTKQMEQAVHSATSQGVKGSTQPAHDVLNQAIRNTPRNAQDLIDKLNSLRDVLSLTKGKPGQATRMIHTPDELLEIKRGIDKTIQTWGPEWQKMGDVQRVKQQLYGAIDGELDRLVGGNAGINQRISSLIPAKMQAKKMETAAPLAQKVAHRMLAHTGALMGAGMGGAAGYREGGIPGAVAGGAAGLILPELAASPSSQMWVARRMASPSTTRAMRGAASQVMKRQSDK